MTFGGVQVNMALLAARREELCGRGEGHVASIRPEVAMSRGEIGPASVQHLRGQEMLPWEDKESVNVQELYKIKR